MVSEADCYIEYSGSGISPACIGGFRSAVLPFWWVSGRIGKIVADRRMGARPEGVRVAVTWDCEYRVVAKVEFGPE